jgi:hypothetical protein
VKDNLLLLLLLLLVLLEHVIPAGSDLRVLTPEAVTQFGAWGGVVVKALRY